MNADVAGKNELRPEEADTVGGQGRAPFHRCRTFQVEKYLGGRDALGSRRLKGLRGPPWCGGRCRGDDGFRGRGRLCLSLEDHPPGCVHYHVLPFGEDCGGVPGAHNAGYSQLPGEYGGVAGAAAFVGDDGAGLAERGDHVRLGHGGHEDVTVGDLHRVG